MKKMLFVYIPIVLLCCACALEGANVIGPAGGFIFYDKGFYSDGWRYLEGSPKDAGKVSSSYTNISWTYTSMGSGKQNTDLILASGTGEQKKAAQFCADFSYGGYTDWFLPSEEELKQMIGTAEHLFEEYKDYFCSSGTSVSYSWYGYGGLKIDYFEPSGIVRPARRF